MIKTALALIVLAMVLGVIVQVRTEFWEVAVLMAVIGFGALALLALVLRYEHRESK